MPIDLAARRVHSSWLPARVFFRASHAGFKSSYRIELPLTRSSSQSSPPPKSRSRKEKPRLRYTDKYPLSLDLARRGTSGDPLRSSRFNARVRVQIVSPDLCDDVLSYIGPTLEKYKGCDIVDLNPGVGLWSQKLHDFLQPRNHVLVESTPDLYKDYLQPLLDKPGSAYKLFEGDIAKKETHEQLFENELLSKYLPDQKPVEPGSPEAQQLNTTLLVTGTLMWDPIAPGNGFDSIGKQLPSLWAQRAWTNEGFHRCGPVRSLLWMTTEDFKGLIPRSLHMFPKYAVYMNFMAKNVQVVTPGHGPKRPAHGTIGRNPELEIQSVIRALRRGRDNGMELPSHRRESIHDFAEDIAQRNIAQGKDEDARLSYVEMQQYLEQQLRAGKSTEGIHLQATIDVIRDTMALEKNPNVFKVPRNPNRPHVLVRSKEGIRKTLVRTSQNQMQRNRAAMCKVSDIGENMYYMECKILAMEDGPEKEAALRELEAVEEDLLAKTERLPVNVRTGVTSEVNERLSLDSPVPRLEWDSRPYEPLVMKEDEVWPMHRVALFDTEPRPLPPGNTPEYFEWIRDFVFALYQSPGTSVIKALDSLQSGASSLVDQAPGLRDPAKGGRLNLNHLKVSMLTTEMVAELCQAYREWPFRSNQATHSSYFQAMGKGMAAPVK